MILLAQIIDKFSKDLEKLYGKQLLPGHRQALKAMSSCRNDKSPVMVLQCANCKETTTLPHSCGHRSCPHCQHHEGQRWLERQRAKLLPVEYFLVTFTIPAALCQVLWYQQRLGYDLLMKVAWQTLASFAAKDPRLKGRIGAHAVLHTHSRRLSYHPHVHLIVPAGAVDTKRKLWRQKKGTYLFNQQNLAKVYRAKWFEAIREKGLHVSGNLPGEWVVDCKHVGKGNKALTYLGKYLYRGVLQEKDILDCTDEQVTFRYWDNSGVIQTRTLPGAEFLWLLLQHVLPKRFRRARDYGFLHSNSKRLIRLLHYLLKKPPPIPQSLPERAAVLCRVCGRVMDIIATRIQLAQPLRC
jgi:hypothetical protein